VLAERGDLDLDAPVQRYWPEFKAPATVRHVLSHQAGLVALDEPAPTEAFYDWTRLCDLLAAQEPQWEPGTGPGESALFYGHLTGEMVGGMAGGLPGRLLTVEACGPLGLAFHVGIGPAEQALAAVLAGLEDGAWRNLAGPELHRRAISNPPGAFD